VEACTEQIFIQVLSTTVAVVVVVVAVMAVEVAIMVTERTSCQAKELRRCQPN